MKVGTSAALPIRSHLLNKIKYLCEPTGFNAVPKQVSYPFGILIGPRDYRYAWQGITSPGSCKGAWMVFYRSAMIKQDGGQDTPGAEH
jgi:hypothetical protein